MQWFEILRPAARLVEYGISARVAQFLELYRSLGIVDKRMDVVRDKEGEKYAFPTAGGIKDLLRYNWDSRYAPKILQGFNRLLIIPGIVGQSVLQESLAQVVVARKDNIKSPWGETLGVGVDKPVWGYWADDPIQYRTTQTLYAANGLPEWASRQEFYRNACLPFPGFDVVLIRSADIELARMGSGKSTYNRPDTEGGKSPLDHRQMLGTSPYDFECALSTDGHMAHYLESIRKNGIAPDVGTPDRGTVSWSSDNRFETEEEDPARALVPYSYWDRRFWLVELWGGYAGNRYRRYAVRGAVRITA